MNAHQALHIVGTAALVHDIGLMKMPEKFKEEDESKLSPEEIELYRTHPTVGAAELEKIPRIAGSIPQAVAHHHVRRNQKGFPADVGGSQRNLISEVIGISDDFAALILRSKNDPSIQPIKEMEKAYEGFTRQVVTAFQNLFVLGAALNKDAA